MIIYEFNHYNKNGIILDKIDLGEFRLVELTRKIDCGREQELVTLLNKINNQGILEFNSSNRTYTNKAGVLPYGALCSAERLFVAAYFATVNKVNICITDFIKCLTKDALELFLNTFKSSDYVDIMLPYVDTLSTSLLRRMIEG